MNRKEKFKELVDSEKDSGADLTIKFELYHLNDGNILLLRGTYSKGKAYSASDGTIRPGNIVNMINKLLHKALEKAVRFTDTPVSRTLKDQIDT